MGRKMKDSGVAWIGEIPEDWTEERLKGLFTFGKGLPITKDDLVEEGIPVISYGQIHSKETTGVEIEQHLIRNVDESFLLSNRQSLVSAGDFIFADTSEDLDGCGNCVYVDREMQLFAGYHTIIFRSRNQRNNKYLAYLFKTDAWRTQIRSKVSGVKLFSISRKILGDATVILPNADEQQRIVSYLDNQCVYINSILNKTRASIEEYKKLKQAIITQAVAKGVRGDRPMKDSGIDAIGKIPQEWNTRKVKSFISIPVVDGPHESPDFYESGIPYISATAIESGKINFDLMRGFISEEYCDECNKRYRPKINDILVIKLGATTGQVAIVDTDRRFNIWVPLAAVRCNSSVNPRFIYYSFQSKNVIRQMELLWTFGTQQTLGVKTIEQLKFAIPFLDEQQEIVDYLDEKCVALDHLVSQKKKFISELENYKKQ